MKAFIFTPLILLFCSGGFSQIHFEKNFSVKVQDKKNRPVSTVGSVTFETRAGIYHAQYNYQKACYIFDSIPVTSGTWLIYFLDYDPMSVIMEPKKDFVFHLNKQPVSYSKHIEMKIHDWENQPITTIGSITFLYENRLHRAKYDKEKAVYVFDSLPFAKGLLAVMCKGYESQEYLIKPRRDFVFQLGRPGSAYFVSERILTPYLNVKGSFVVSLKATDSVLNSLQPYLDSLNIQLSGKLTDQLIEVRTKKSLSSKKIIFELTKHPLIYSAGEAYRKGSGTIQIKEVPPIPDGWFTGAFTISYEEFVSDRTQQLLLEKYGLIVVNKTGGFITVRTTEKSQGTANEIARLIIKEPVISYCTVLPTGLFPPQITR